jgi:acetyltransferase-like isoleucine patch superfamily enzyme
LNPFEKAVRILMIILEELRGWFESLFIANLPGRIGFLFRRLYWSCRFRTRDRSFHMSTGCVITAPENISIGKDIKMMHNCCLYAHGGGSIQLGDRVAMNSNVTLGASENGTIEIGADVLIGPNVVFRASNHKFSKKEIPVNLQGHTGGAIKVGDDVWIGANAVILSGVTIGKGAIIGAGAVVKGYIPSYSLAGGVPAKVIRESCRV